jgi:predicted O-methyltransferase YrrM
MAPRTEETLPVGDTKNLKDVQTFANDVFNSILGAQQVQASWLGAKLGWYECLANNGPLSTSQLAELTSTCERYAREWCEHQTVSGWIMCENPDSEERKYFLSHAQKAVLTETDSLSYLMPACKFVAYLGTHLPKMKEVYQDDGGISWDELGQDARESQAEMNRPMFLQQLGQEYLASIPEVDSALKNGGRVADIGAGFCWSSIGVAKAYPTSKVDAYDLDEDSILAAEKNIAKAGLKDRVKAHCIDAASLVDQVEPYDLVMALECIHDMGDPVSVLTVMRKLAGVRGTVIVMDERSQESFTGGTNNDIEKFLYGFSITCCLADCKSHPNSVETGTVMRPSQLTWYAIEAGFRGIETLPIENDFFRFYKLKL